MEYGLWVNASKVGRWATTIQSTEWVGTNNVVYGVGEGLPRARW